MTETPSWLWVVFTIVASIAQTARNAMQRELTGTLGTVGATHTRFLFGFPFAFLIFVAMLLASGQSAPSLNPTFMVWVLVGSIAQIFATGMMLAAMGERSFVVTISYTKTEPVHVALFGLVFLGDVVTLPLAVAILVATVGVMVMSWQPGAASFVSLRPALLGIVSGAMFGLSATGYRGAILAVAEDVPFYVSSGFTLAVGLAIQSVLLSLYLAVRERHVLASILHAWRPSLFAGFTGAIASTFWFAAFALATAASVRTLALIEVLFAQAVSVLIFRQAVSLREIAGIVLVVGGVALLLSTY